MKRVGTSGLVILVLASVVAAVPELLSPAPAAADHGTSLAGPPDENGNWAYCNIALEPEGVVPLDTEGTVRVACQFGPTVKVADRVSLSVYSWGDYDPSNLADPVPSWVRRGPFQVVAEGTSRRGRFYGEGRFVFRVSPSPWADPFTYYRLDGTADCGGISVEDGGGNCEFLEVGFGSGSGLEVPDDHWPGGFSPVQSAPDEQLFAACYKLIEKVNDLLDDWAVNPALCLSDPINTGLGAFEDAHTDAALPGPGLGVAFTRLYTSADDTVGPLGRGWTHGYNASLDVSDPALVTFRSPSGQQLAFTQNPDLSYSGAAGALADLTTTPSGYEVTRRSDGLRLIFDTSGVLTGVRDENDQGVDLAHDAGGDLISVTDTAGQSVTFTNDGGHVTGLMLPDGRSVSYGYTGDRLTSVTALDGGTTSYEYDASGRLVRVIDPTGVTKLENVYDTSGRVTSQRDALGNESTFAVDEAAGVRTVTMTDAAGQAWSDVYLGNVLVERADPQGHATAFSHDQDLNVTGVTDPDGNRWSMAYDAAGNLTSRTDPTGATTSWSYDADHRPLTRTDPLGNATALSYDASGNLTEITDAAGHTTTLTYSSTGRPLTVTDPTGATTSFTWDAVDRLTVNTDALGHTTEFGYDASGQVSSVTDAAGAVTTYAYDAAGRVTAVTDALGATTSPEYDAAGRLTSSTDALGGVTAYAYNDAGEVVSATDPTGATTTYDYDARGLLVGTTDGLGRTTTYAYDAARRLASTTDPTGATTSYGYDAAGNQTSVNDPLGQTTRTTYDAAGRRASTIDPTGATTTYAYDAAGHMRSETDPLGAVTTFEYDDLGHLVSTTDPLGAETRSEYDAAGRLTATIAPDGGRTEVGYDAMGRQVTRTDPLGAVTTLDRDPVGRVVADTDPLGNQTTHAYDDVGRLLTVTDPVGAVTTYTYDPLGRQTSRIDANGHTTGLAYDAVGRVLDVTAPDGTHTTSAYDPVGNRTSRTDANGHTTRWTYDELDREIERRSPAGRRWTSEYDAAGRVTREVSAAGNASSDPDDGATTYTYDGAGRVTGVDYSDSATYTPGFLGPFVRIAEPTPDVAFAYDAAGRRVSMSDGRGEQTYAYDAAGRLTTITRGPTIISYGYDAVGRIAARTYPRVGSLSDPGPLLYAYDEAGHLVSLSDAEGTTAYAYDAAGRFASTTHPNGAVETRTYDGAGRVTGIDTPGVETLSYEYDPVGNPTTVTGSPGVETYGYDARDQLTEVCYGAGCLDSIRYGYDPVGNRLRESRPLLETTYTYGQDDELIQSGAAAGGETLTTTIYDHDADGRLVRAGGDRYAYDAAGRLVAHLEGPLVHHYAYDGEGKRVRANTEVAGVLTLASRSLTWDPQFPVPRLVTERFDETGARSDFAWGQGLAWWDFDDATDASGTDAQSPEGRHVAHADRLGSVVALTDGDAVVEDRRVYEPFGSRRSAPGASVPTVDPTSSLSTQPLAVSDMPFGFTGEYVDAATGLYDLRARDYDPALGRFTARDALKPLTDEPFVSAYAYAGNRSTVMVDPTGMRAQECVGDVADAVGKDPMQVTVPDLTGNFVGTCLNFFGDILDWAHLLGQYIQPAPSSPSDPGSAPAFPPLGSIGIPHTVSFCERDLGTGIEVCGPEQTVVEVRTPARNPKKNEQSERIQVREETDEPQPNRMRFQIQWDTGRGGPTFSANATASKDTGVTVAQAILTLNLALAEVWPAAARKAAAPAVADTIVWIQSRPSQHGVSSIGQVRTKPFPYRGHVGSRVDVNNDAGTNLLR